MSKWNGLERSEIKRGTLRSWNSSIASKSAKRVREDRERGKVLAELKAESDGICPICRDEPAVDGHELLARSAGGSITDKANIRLIGRKCHDWITFTAEGVRWATETGWKVSRYA